MSDCKINVLGSVNMDVVFRTSTLPKIGETLICESVEKHPGGKGLNQAIAASRAAAKVEFIAAVGDDPYGTELLEFLKNNGVDLNYVAVQARQSTGLAHIIVDKNGQNMIIVSSGANKTIDPSVFHALDENASVALCQLETPISVVERYLRHWSTRPAQTVMNAAPADHNAIRLFPLCDYVIVNESELSFFAKMGKIPDLQSETMQICQELAHQWDTNLILTMGASGVILASSELAEFLPADKVVATDTTGAGDCFCGYFAAALGRGRSPKIAVHIAMKASAISVTRSGASSSIPRLHEMANLR